MLKEMDTFVDGEAYETFNGIDDNHITDMAKVGVVYDKKIGYIIAIWGHLSDDRITPHIHIWRANDAKNDYKNFNLDVSLVDILVNKKLVLLSKKDTKRNVDEIGRTEDWAPFDSIKNVFWEKLEENEYSLLEAIIDTWNKERDFIKTDRGGNPLLDWLNKRGLQVHMDFQPLFTKEK